MGILIIIIFSNQPNTKIINILIIGDQPYTKIISILIIGVVLTGCRSV